MRFSHYAVFARKQKTHRWKTKCSPKKKEEQNRISSRLKRLKTTKNLSHICTITFFQTDPHHIFFLEKGNIWDKIITVIIKGSSIYNLEKKTNQKCNWGGRKGVRGGRRIKIMVF